MSDFLAANRRLVLLTLAAALVLGVATLSWRLPQPAAPLSIEAPTPAARAIKVYVSGEVAQPGVYSLRAGDRVEELLQAAGGPTAAADLERLNLSQRVKDEDHVRVPRLAAPTAAVPGGAPVAPGAPAELPERLDLNSATARQLDVLPGIGPVIAARILAYREKNGPFRRIEDLREAKLVNNATYEKIKDLVVVR